MQSQDKKNKKSTIILYILFICSIISLIFCIKSYAQNIRFGGMWYILSVISFIFSIAIFVVHEGMKENSKVVIEKKLTPKFLRIIRIIIWIMLIGFIFQKVLVYFIYS
jgi:hypothetical protein